jgi:hypothetical protein
MDSGSNTSDTRAVGTASGASSGSLRQAAQAKTSRRSMLRRGGVVAAGAVAGLTLLDQRRAQAADGGAFTLGSANSATHTTSLAVTPAGTTLNPLFRINGSGLSGTSTTMIVDGPGAVQGKALIVNGNSGGTGIITSASNGTGGTVGLALAASGGNGADAIHASSDKGTAVSAGSAHGAGVRASGRRGGVFSGKSAAIQLEPSAGSHPVRGAKGDLFVDHNAHLFFCRGGTNWVKLA